MVDSATLVLDTKVDVKVIDKGSGWDVNREESKSSRIRFSEQP